MTKHSFLSSVLDAILGRRLPNADSTPQRRLYAEVDEDVPADAPFPYVWVDDDGSARELNADERKYLRTPFDPRDGARPYVKSNYRARTPDGRLRGYLRRNQLPWRVRPRSA